MAMRVGSREKETSAGLQSLDRHAYIHTLSLRLTGEQYRRLRRFVTGHEDRTGQRITHQAVLEAALADYLDRHNLATLG
jgi:hypothetical protein